MRPWTLLEFIKKGYYRYDCKAINVPQPLNLLYCFLSLSLHCSCQSHTLSQTDWTFESFAMSCFKLNLIKLWVYLQPEANVSCVPYRNKCGVKSGLTALQGCLYFSHWCSLFFSVKYLHGSWFLREFVIISWGNEFLMNWAIAVCFTIQFFKETSQCSRGRKIHLHSDLFYASDEGVVQHGCCSQVLCSCGRWMSVCTCSTLCLLLRKLFSL